ncbi:DUF3325 domain-containing protein [Pseudomonas sp. JM0905a]|uniref:DUF3325 domain-containing protein n=1 Tax=Metapseudomonas resinovorans TaxID=53412 RepID=A0ABT4Y138_METRE|nr:MULTISPECIES: DUF3325 domain-containing protein [Pseudomonas]MBD2838005.1 DUF3325 domain-containing protein [Pseudomonas sp. JM0905a]MDA8482501.1 DUF3325 domain-containing protein [Pseudomonas resinovorans]
MLVLSFAFCYLAMTGLALAMSRQHKLVFSGAPSESRSRLLQIGAVLAMLVGLVLAIAELGGEIGGVIWLCQLMLAGLLLVALLAWQARWVLPLVALLPLGGGVLALV